MKLQQSYIQIYIYIYIYKCVYTYIILYTHMYLIILSISQHLVLRAHLFTLPLMDHDLSRLSLAKKWTSYGDSMHNNAHKKYWG